MGAMTTVCPKLVVRSADEATDYYRQVFGAEAGPRHAEGDTVLHASITLFGTLVTLKDADETDPGPETLGKAGVIMEITTEDPDTLADRAVQAGGAVVFPVADQPYGARAGRVRDPFGHEWIVSTPIG